MIISNSQNLTVDLMFWYSARGFFGKRWLFVKRLKNEAAHICDYNGFDFKSQNIMTTTKYHCEMANRRCMKVDLKISKYHDNIKFSKSHSWFDVLIFCNHHGFIVKYQNIMIISKYHHDVVYERYIKDHLIISIKYHDNIKISW